MTTVTKYFRRTTPDEWRL